MTLVVLFFYNCAMADEVILVNGDRLSGRIVSITDGILTLETSYSEPVKLKFEAVDRMSSSEPVEIHLSDGEILKGKITGEVHRKIAVKAGVNREQVTVGFDSITALNPPPQKPVTWKGDITLGGNWQDGNSDTLSISAGGLATRRTEKDRFRINVLYNQAKNSGQRTAENTYGQLKYDYFLNPNQVVPLPQCGYAVRSIQRYKSQDRHRSWSRLSGLGRGRSDFEPGSRCFVYL